MSRRVMTYGTFQWDIEKSRLNLHKHNVDFFEAMLAFFDPARVIATDEAHSHLEPRYFCLGLVNGGIMTVRFTYRHQVIRIFGAGYWRKGRQLYEKERKKAEK